MDISVIVITYNRHYFLSRCLHHLLKQDFKGSYEIIVVDDGSTDKTKSVIKQLQEGHKNLHYVPKEHGGYARARNLGLKHARGRIIAFTDDDCFVSAEWLTKIQESMAKNSADAVGGPILNPTDKYVAWAHYILNFSSCFPAKIARFADTIPTANVAYRAKSIQGHSFPEYLGFANYEDSVFNYGLRKEGKKIVFSPEIQVTHHTWEEKYGLKKFFEIQKRHAMGFCGGGYVIHGMAGRVLIRLRFLNILCPGLPTIFLRSLKAGYAGKFLSCFPLIFMGEFYKGLLVLTYKNIPNYEPSPK